MKWFGTLSRILLFPFELVGQFIAESLRFVWSFSGKFLLSPWGLLVPITFLILLLFVMQLSRTPFGLAEIYSRELEDCSDEKIPVLIDALLHLEEAGLPSLVRGLNSEREAVYLASRQALQDELKHRRKDDDSLRQLKYYRLLSETLLEQAKHFRPTARLTSVRLAQQLQRELTAGLAMGFAEGQLTRQTLHPDSQSKRLQARLSDESQQINKNCEQLFIVLDAARKRLVDPKVGGEIVSDSLVLRHRQNMTPELLAANGLPFQADSPSPGNTPFGNAAAEPFDALSMPRAERLLAYHQSDSYRRQMALPYIRPGMQDFESSTATASMGSRPGLRTGQSHEESSAMSIGSALLAHKSPNYPGASDVGPSYAGQSGKIARQYGIGSSNDGSGQGDLDISSDYLLRMGADRPPERVSRSDTANHATDGRDTKGEDAEEQDNFLTDDLIKIPLDRIPSLSSSRLMRLLQHPDRRRVEEARKTLIGRDGFRDLHLKLAYRLYHPRPTVRQGLVSMISSTSGIRQNIWFTELLKDPDKEVRYRAASYLATSNDTAMLRLLAERGKNDTDQRIIDLADQIRKRLNETRK